jgi:hypothetical protein
MGKKRKLAFFILGGVCALAILSLKRQSLTGTPGLSGWQVFLTRRYGAEKARRLADAIRQEYGAVLAQAELPEHPVLRWHIREKILPGLALYFALRQEHGGDKAAALAVVDEAFRADLYPKNQRLLAPLRVLGNGFPIFRLLLPQVMKQYPPEGWDIQYIENNDERVAFDITRCFYLDTLTAHGAPELTASFCKTDDIMAECFPPSLRFERPHTMGRGEARCNFQYYRVKQG